MSSSVKCCSTRQTTFAMASRCFVYFKFRSVMAFRKDSMNCFSSNLQPPQYHIATITVQQLGNSTNITPRERAPDNLAETSKPLSLNSEYWRVSIRYYTPTIQSHLKQLVPIFRSFRGTAMGTTYLQPAMPAVFTLRFHPIPCQLQLHRRHLQLLLQMLRPLAPPLVPLPSRTPHSRLSLQRPLRLAPAQ